jgi:hypothetical protein
MLSRNQTKCGRKIRRNVAKTLVHVQKEVDDGSLTRELERNWNFVKEYPPVKRRKKLNIPIFCHKKKWRKYNVSAEKRA